MKIKVDRTNTQEGDLVFTVTVSEPHVSCFGEHEKNLIIIFDKCIWDICETIPDQNIARKNALLLTSEVKPRLVHRMLVHLKDCIKNDFDTKFEPIYQEVYNWIYDHQNGILKECMLEFDPQRSRYYFDNDPEMKKPDPQQSEHEDEDDYDDED